MNLLCSLVFLANVIFAFAATPAQWRSRSIYQIVVDRFARSDGSTTAQCDPGRGEYCGGSWRGLIEKLDYIQGMGFTAVWISPITNQEQRVTTDLTSYHGYWQTDLYKLNSAFGTGEDLKALSDALHSRGMYLMLDVVVNHFAWAGNGSTVDYSTFNPFNNEKYFHPFKLLSNDDSGNVTAAQVDWIGDEVLSCPDLRTEAPAVLQMFQDWIASLVSNYSVDGLRIDTVLNVDPNFFPGFSNAAGIFCTGEVVNGDAASACPLQNDLDSILNFPMYYSMTQAFNSTSGNITALAEQIEDVRQHCRDVQSLATFSENHDMARFASYTNDLSLAQNIITFNILADGIPIIYYGQEQHEHGAFNPVNREALWLTKYNTDYSLYQLVAKLNQIRTYALERSNDYGKSNGLTIYQSEHTMAVRKGVDGSQVVMVVTNLGQHAKSVQDLDLKNTGFKPGDKVMDILVCEEQTTRADSSIAVKMTNGIPHAFYPSTALNGSKICRNGSSTTSALGSFKSSSAVSKMIDLSTVSILAVVAASSILPLWMTSIFHGIWP